MKIFTILFSSLFFSLVNAQTADFIIDGNNTVNCTPATIKFTQNCTGNPAGFSWSFGNGQTASSGVATTVYNSPGTYTVKLTAIYSNASVSVSKTVVINQGIKRGIVADKNYICLPGDIQFSTAGTGNISNYQWNFGDGSGLVNSTTEPVTHTFSSYGKFTVKLRATDASGCYSDTTLLIAVQKPPVTGMANRATACIPATTNFSALVSVPANTTVTNYVWDFGDGNPTQTTAGNTVSHVYVNTGAYGATLNITTSNGCTSTYAFSNLSYGTPPAAAITYAVKPLICGSETALVVAKSATANRYFWSFGDGTTASTNDTIIGHKFTTLGTKSIGVTAYNNGCQGAFNRVSVVVQGVIASYNFSNKCTDKNTYAFTNTSMGNVSSQLWNFGDASATSNSAGPTHTYVAGSQFLSSLIVNDAVTGCSDTTSKLLYTPVSVFNSPTGPVCKNSPVSFSVTSNYLDTLQRYSWHLQGKVYGPDSLPSKNVVADATGAFDNFVVINRGAQYCLDTLKATALFTVKAPTAVFTVKANSCTNEAVVLTNTSMPFSPADSIKFWNWDKSNGSSDDVAFEPTPFKYDSTGSYQIALTAIDKNGCTDTISKTISISLSPSLSVLKARDTICAGAQITLSAVTTSPVTWFPATGLSCTTCSNTIAKPQTTTLYYVTVGTGTNCVVKDSIFVKVNQSSTGNATGASTTICSGESITLGAEPQGAKITWSPATGLTDSTIYNPVASPLQTTVYAATITDSLACFTQKYLYTVKVNPRPTVNAGPDKFYSRGTSFNLAPVYTGNIIAYTWSPAGTLSCTDCANPAGVANGTVIYTVTAISDSGCIAADTVTIFTNCIAADIHLPGAFTPNGDNLNDFFYPLTSNLATIVSFTVFNRSGKVLFAAHNFPGNDKRFGWDGKWRGANQAQGNYVYIMEAECENGQKATIKGSVLLLR